METQTETENGIEKHKSEWGLWLFDFSEIVITELMIKLSVNYFNVINFSCYPIDFASFCWEP